MKATCVERKRLKVAVVGIAMPLIKAREPNRDRGAIMWFGQRRFGLAFLGRMSMFGTRKGVQGVHQTGSLSLTFTFLSCY